MPTFDHTNPGHDPQPQPGPRVLQGTVVTGSGAAPAGGAAVPAAGQMPSMRELLHGFRRCWIRAITLGLLCAAATAAAAWFGIPKLKAKARTLLKVEASQPFFLFADNSRSDLGGFKKTQATLAKSRMVLNAAMSELGDCKLVQQQPDPVQWLDDHVQADYSAGPELLTIWLQGDNPDDQIKIVNAIAKVYLREIVAKEHNARFQMLDQLKEIQARFEEKVKSKRKALAQLAEAAGANTGENANLKQKMALEQLNLAQAELVRLKSDMRRLNVQALFGKEKEKAAGNLEVPDKLLNDEIQKDPVIQGYQVRQAELEAEIEKVKQVNPRRWESLSQGTRTELETVRKALEQRKEKLRPELVDRVREKVRENAEARTAEDNEKVAYYQRLEKELTTDIDDLTKKAKTLNGQSLGLEDIRKEIAQADSVLDRITMQTEAMNVERNAPPRVHLIEEGVVSLPDQRRRQMMAAGGGGVAGLLLVVFGLSWWECRALRINSVDEVVRGAGLQVLGTLPLMPTSRLLPGSERTAEWQNFLLESVDLTRTTLLHLARVDGVRVVMITSAVGGEGKTSLSSHLATSLARAGRKTLLVDCDLRKPSLHHVFGLDREEGVCELLRGQINLADAARPTTATEGLYVLPAGQCDERSLACLARGRLGPVFAALRQEYDFIIVDSSPVLPVADALMVAQESDGVLFSVLRDVSQVGRITSAYARLAALGIRALGAVVTGAAQGDFYYGANYRYLNKPGTDEDGAGGDAASPDGELVEEGNS